MKKSFISADWFVGFMVSIVVLLISGTAFIQDLETRVYDLGVRFSERTPSDKIKVIAIDDQSIANIGRWPWSRDIHAQLLDKLVEGKAKVIGHSVMFLEPQIDPGYTFIKELHKIYGETSLVKNVSADLAKIKAKLSELATPSPTEEGEEPNPKDVPAQELKSLFDQSSLAGKAEKDIQALEAFLQKAEAALNTDKILGQALDAAGNVVLAMPLVIGEPVGKPDQELPDYVQKNVLLNISDKIGAESLGMTPYSAVSAFPPIAKLGSKAIGIGHLNMLNDSDGGVRSEALTLAYYGSQIPAMSLKLAAASLNLKADDIKVMLGEGVQLGGLTIATDENLRMHTFFYNEKNGQPPFTVDSFYDVISGKIPPSKYKDKIVLIGSTAAGIGDWQVTPVGAQPPIQTLAHTVSSILQEDFFIEPEWAEMARWGLFLFIALYVIFILPRLRAGTAAILTLILLLGIIGGQVAVQIMHTWWLQLMMPAFLLFIGHLVLTTKRFLVTEKGKEKSDAESAESNRMLGLAHQGKGDLDMAYACFRKCNMDESILDLLYNLGLDFERKRQFNKAVSVYQYMTEHDAGYRDVKDRIKRNKSMEETVMLGGSGGYTAGGTLVVEDGVQKPMLGRYQVEKELGKGAMGVVYLGKDPKINRVVAIKTMALSQEFESGELKEVKERFFREAETAGRLTHPNIVTIYDAGEEQDLAYIAMEFLKGKDLDPYIKVDNLLPMAQVIEMIAMSAEALDYAHSQNVVHRDIKPGNIMYEPDSGELKITDFGIARITDASKTKTGMVMGTPSYMSPEQLADAKVDGRSDLFSLGVMLYEMISGQKPFQADSIATLMFKIANEAHADITTIRADAPACLKQIIDRALTKDVEQRYQSGGEFARELRACGEQLPNE